MTSGRVPVVHLEYLDHDHGHWCNHCRLATGLRVWLVGRCELWLHLQVRLWCTECHGRDVTVAGDARHC